VLRLARNLIALARRVLSGEQQAAERQRSDPPFDQTLSTHGLYSV